MSIKNRAAKNRRHKRTCESKRRFADREAALAAMRSLGWKRGAVIGQLQAYRCLACKLWHFGHRL